MSVQELQDPPEDVPPGDEGEGGLGGEPGGVGGEVLQQGHHIDVHQKAAV